MTRLIAIVAMIFIGSPTMADDSADLTQAIHNRLIQSHEDSLKTSIEKQQNDRNAADKKSSQDLEKSMAETKGK